MPSLSIAADFTLGGFLETGSRSQGEDFEEEDEDREYTYQKYHLGLEHRLSNRFHYELGSLVYNKNYKSKDSLDNTVKILNSNSSYYLNKQKTEFLKLDIKLRYKEKRFRKNASGEYDQIMFLPRLIYDKKDYYTIKIGTGINEYNYRSTGGNDQLKFFFKVGAKRYLLEKKLMLASSYKLETSTHKRANRRKNKNNVMMGVDYLFSIPFIHKIAARAKLGHRDTKDDERDEDFDYKYGEYSVKTEHRIRSRIQTHFKCQYFTKDYLTADLDHRGFYISGTVRYKMLTDKTRALYFTLASKHKEVKYPLKSGSDYKKETIEIKGTYRRKKNWKLSASAKGTLYNYRDSTKDKNRYYAVLSFEKLFPGNNLGLSLDGKYKYSDNKHANNSEEEAIRLAFQFSF